MKVKKEFENYVIHYIVKGELVSKLLKNLSLTEIKTFVEAGHHLKYFENERKTKPTPTTIIDTPNITDFP
jgi:hypothetical protein